ncbi:hypothetical protein OH782_42520 (plasmid) [Streptomyces sp. NBC_01544]|uniref:hypothetical protein n=1 Tax=Streptomyces sp. NBC_01544 TaxID=2975871 RepID=UPI002F90E397
MKRILALLLAAVAALCVLTPSPAVADGPIHDGVEIACELGGTGAIGSILGSDDLCDVVGDVVEKKVKDEWKSVWDSVIGDVIRSSQDVAKWMLKILLTLALQGPSLNLEATGLFGQDASLAGMLVWLGWVIASLGLMWQLGKMAVTGQMKYAGQAMLGFLQNALITGVGVTVVAMLLKLGDAMTTGLVNVTFDTDGEAYERIVKVMIPAGIANPITVLGVVQVLFWVGLIQLVMVFLRQSAIPLQCLLLPIAGAGRMGGDATRQWAPRLITSILVVIAYKPILAIIICTGFAEFGHSSTLSEWLRGVATLVLGVLAPGPLSKLFAPLGAEMGAGLSAGGALGAAAGAGAYLGKAVGGDGASSGGGGGGEPTTAVEHARYVEQSMGTRGSQSSDGDAGGEAVAQAARNDAGARVPAARSAEAGATTGAKTAEVGAAGAGATTGAQTAEVRAAGAGAGSSAAAGVAGPVAIGIQVLDGVNDAVKGASGAIGGGDK